MTGPTPRIDSANFQVGELVFYLDSPDSRNDGLYEVVSHAPNPSSERRPPIRFRSALVTLALQGWRTSP